MTSSRAPRGPAPRVAAPRVAASRVAASRVAVFGGGPAGASTALTLVQMGLRVTVLEATSAPRRKVGECLPPSATPLLRRLGLDAAALRREGSLPSHGHRFVWGSARVGERPFLAGSEGDGWHLDRARFEALLARRAVESGVDWRWGARAKAWRRRGGRWQLEVETDGGAESLEADFVADATGRRAVFARNLDAGGAGAKRLRYDRLVGIAALLESPVPAQDSFTLVEARPEGWWYSALLGDGRLAVAFMSDGDLLDVGLRGRADPGLWRRRLWESEATRQRVEASGYATPETLRTLPAETSRLDRIAGEGWLAVGDAAAAYDPLSSHGIGSALGAGYYAGRAIADHLAGESCAIPAYLSLVQKAYGTCLDLQRREYRRERRFSEAPFWKRRHGEGYCMTPIHTVRTQGNH